MNLHDPARPKIGGRPAFLSGTIIPAPQIWPLSDLPDSTTGGYHLRMMLLMKGEGLGAAWMEAHLPNIRSLMNWLLMFKSSPEEAIESVFPLAEVRKISSRTAGSRLSSSQSADDLGL